MRRWRKGEKKHKIESRNDEKMEERWKKTQNRGWKRLKGMVLVTWNTEKNNNEKT